MINLSKSLLIILCFAPTSLAAQGFDCEKAQKPVEKLICSTPEISALDKELNTVVKARLNSDTHQNDDFLRDSRQWLRDRDKNCIVPPGLLSEQESNDAITCLSKAYRAQLDILAALPAVPKDTDDKTKDVCHQFADTYRSVISSRPNDPTDPNAPLTQKPFDFLSHTPNSEINLTEPVITFSHVSAHKLDKWALTRNPAIKFTSQVKKRILDLVSSANQQLTIDHASATNFYVASIIAGTADCIESVYFEVKDGITQLTPDPLWPEMEMQACGVDHFFGVIGSRTVAIEYRRSFNEADMSRSLKIKAWNDKTFSPHCNVVLSYNPAFIAADSNVELSYVLEPDQKCLSPTCKALQPAVLALAESVQKSPTTARNEAIGKLSEDQRYTFSSLEQLSHEQHESSPPSAEELADPATLRDTAPLQIPLVYKGELYLASFGHYTIGWRVYPDWSVRIERLEAGSLKSLGISIVAVRFGSLREFKIQ